MLEGMFTLCCLHAVLLESFTYDFKLPVLCSCRGALCKWKFLVMKELGGPSIGFSTWYTSFLLQKNLFNADKIVKRKPRPFSSAHLREKDNIRAQPRSAGLTRSNSQGYCFVHFDIFCTPFKYVKCYNNTVVSILAVIVHIVQQ